MDFDPFGVILKSSQSNTFANRFELQSKERDLTFGLNWVNFGARRMNPTIGRMDNIDALASKFASHSLYNYTLNNPLVIIDPDGNESRDIWGNTTFNGFVGDDGSGNFVGSTGGGGDDKEKGKKKEEEKNRDRPLLREDGTKITDYDYYILGEGNEREGYNNTWLEYIDMALSLLNPTKYVGLLAKVNVGAKVVTAAKIGEKIGVNSRKLSTSEIGDFLKAGVNWHKTSAKSSYLSKFQKQLKGDSNADFYLDQNTKEVLLKSNKNGIWINTKEKLK